MAETPNAAGSGEGPTADSAADPEPPPGSEPNEAAAPGGRPPGWREVLGVSALVLALVFGVELLSSLVPSVREAFRGFPVTIVVLVAGTVGLLLWIGIRRPRG